MDKRLEHHSNANVTFEKYLIIHRLSDCRCELNRIAMTEWQSYHSIAVIRRIHFISIQQKNTYALQTIRWLKYAISSNCAVVLGGDFPPVMQNTTVSLSYLKIHFVHINPLAKSHDILPHNLFTLENERFTTIDNRSEMVHVCLIINISNFRHKLYKCQSAFTQRGCENNLAKNSLAIRIGAPNQYHQIHSFKFRFSCAHFSYRIVFTLRINNYGMDKCLQLD